MNEILESRNDLLTINELEKNFESFIDYLDCDDLTLKTYRVGINAFIEYLKNNDIKQPTRDDIISFRNMLRNNYSSNTVNTYMISVRALFKYLEIHEIYKNICVDIKGAKYNNTPKKQVLSLEQTKEIYSSLTDVREKCLFSLICSTGLRGIEVARARIEDIKEYNGEIILWVWGKKRDTYDEYVKLSEQVINDIQEYIGERKSGYIFISNSNHNKNGGVTTTTLRRMIKSIFKRFNLDSDTFSLHSCRRTFSCIAYESGASIYDIQQVLRHKSINTTTRYLQQVNRDKNKTESNVANLMFA